MVRAANTRRTRSFRIPSSIYPAESRSGLGLPAFVTGPRCEVRLRLTASEQEAYPRAHPGGSRRKNGDKMIPPDLPAELKSALAANLEGLSRDAAAARAALISQTYRDGGTSRVIRDEI